jgi:hypothetical protein
MAAVGRLSALRSGTHEGTEQVTCNNERGTCDGFLVMEGYELGGDVRGLLQSLRTLAAAMCC